MKKKIYFLLGIIVFLVITNCSALPNVESNFAKTWLLVSFQDYSKKELIEKNAKIVLSSSRSDNAFLGDAFLGCHPFRFKIKILGKGKMKVYYLNNEQTNCMDRDLENAFIERFKTMNSYLREGHFLILKSSNGDSIKFLEEDWD